MASAWLVASASTSLMQTLGRCCCCCYCRLLHQPRGQSRALHGLRRLQRHPHLDGHLQGELLHRGRERMPRGPRVLSPDQRLPRLDHGAHHRVLHLQHQRLAAECRHVRVAPGPLPRPTQEHLLCLRLPAAVRRECKLPGSRIQSQSLTDSRSHSAAIKAEAQLRSFDYSTGDSEADAIARRKINERTSASLTLSLSHSPTCSTIPCGNQYSTSSSHSRPTRSLTSRSCSTRSEYVQQQRVVCMVALTASRACVRASSDVAQGRVPNKVPQHQPHHRLHRL